MRDQSRRKMKLGPQRDRLLLEEKTALLFQNKLKEYDDDDDDEDDDAWFRRRRINVDVAITFLLDPVDGK